MYQRGNTDLPCRAPLKLLDPYKKGAIRIDGHGDAEFAFGGAFEDDAKWRSSSPGQPRAAVATSSSRFKVVLMMLLLLSARRGSRQKLTGGTPANYILYRPRSSSFRPSSHLRSSSLVTRSDEVAACFEVFRTSSSTKIGQSTRNASASASEGRESTLTTRPSRSIQITAKNVSSRSSVTTTLCTCVSSPVSTFLIRSCVIGRGVFTFSISSAIAFASYTPTQIGNTVSPATSLRITIGIFVTGSINRPRIVIST